MFYIELKPPLGKPRFAQEPVLLHQKIWETS